jgi:hypothetical protein
MTSRSRCVVALLPPLVDFLILLPLQSLVTPICVTATKTLTLQQSPLAFFFRFFLRTYRFPNPSVARNRRQIEGYTKTTAQNFISQSVFPCCSSLLRGAAAMLES